MYEKGNTPMDCKELKVMLEEDYLSTFKHQNIHPSQGAQAIARKVLLEIVIPALTKEVNEGKNFANLRQIYNGMVLATWYKQALRRSILTRIYANKDKVSGVDLINPVQAQQEVYQQYLKAFKKGTYNFIKEEQDPLTGQVIPRKYFSGGFSRYNPVVVKADASMAAGVVNSFKHLMIVSTVVLTLGLGVALPHSALAKGSEDTLRMPISASIKGTESMIMMGKAIIQIIGRKPIEVLQKFYMYGDTVKVGEVVKINRQGELRKERVIGIWKIDEKYLLATQDLLSTPNEDNSIIHFYDVFPETKDHSESMIYDGDVDKAMAVKKLKYFLNDSELLSQIRNVAIYLSMILFFNSYGMLKFNHWGDITATLFLAVLGLAELVDIAGNTKMNIKQIAFLNDLLNQPEVMEISLKISKEFLESNASDKDKKAKIVFIDQLAEALPVKDPYHAKFMILIAQHPKLAKKQLDNSLDWYKNFLRSRKKSDTDKDQVIKVLKEIITSLPVENPYLEKFGYIIREYNKKVFEVKKDSAMLNIKIEDFIRKNVTLASLPNGTQRAILPFLDDAKFQQLSDFIKAINPDLAPIVQFTLTKSKGHINIDCAMVVKNLGNNFREALDARKRIGMGILGFVLGVTVTYYLLNGSAETRIEDAIKNGTYQDQIQKEKTKLYGSINDFLISDLRNYNDSYHKGSIPLKNMEEYLSKAPLSENNFKALEDYVLTFNSVNNSSRRGNQGLDSANDYSAMELVSFRILLNQSIHGNYLGIVEFYQKIIKAGDAVIPAIRNQVYKGPALNNDNDSTRFMRITKDSMNRMTFVPSGPNTIVIVSAPSNKSSVAAISDLLKENGIPFKYDGKDFAVTIKGHLDKAMAVKETEDFFGNKLGSVNSNVLNLVLLGIAAGQNEVLYTLTVMVIIFGPLLGSKSNDPDENILSDEELETFRIFLNSTASDKEKIKVIHYLDTMAEGLPTADPYHAKCLILIAQYPKLAKKVLNDYVEGYKYELKEAPYADRQQAIKVLREIVAALPPENPFRDKFANLIKPDLAMIMGRKTKGAHIPPGFPQIMSCFG